MCTKFNYVFNVAHGENANCKVVNISDPDNCLEKINLTLDDFSLDNTVINDFVCDTFLSGKHPGSDIAYTIYVYDNKTDLNRVKFILGFLLMINGSNWSVSYDYKEKEKYDKTNDANVFVKDFYIFEDENSECWFELSTSFIAKDTSLEHSVIYEIRSRNNLD